MPSSKDRFPKSELESALAIRAEKIGLDLPVDDQERKQFIENLVGGEGDDFTALFQMVIAYAVELERTQQLPLTDARINQFKQELKNRILSEIRVAETQDDLNQLLQMAWVWVAAGTLIELVAPNIKAAETKLDTLELQKKGTPKASKYRRLFLELFAPVAPPEDDEAN